jgi:hypothetical protein
MRHKGFNIEPSERKSGEWRATISHPDGHLLCAGKQVEQYETGAYPNSDSALEAAKMEIDFLRVRQYFKR